MRFEPRLSRSVGQCSNRRATATARVLGNFKKQEVKCKKTKTIGDFVFESLNELNRMESNNDNNNNSSSRDSSNITAAAAAT